MTLLSQLLPFLILLNICSCSKVDIKENRPAKLLQKDATTQTSIHGSHFDTIDPTLPTIEEMEAIMKDAMDNWNLLFPGVENPEKKRKRKRNTK